MNPRVLLLLVPLLLGGIAFWLVQSDDEPTLPGKADTTAEAPDPAVASSARAQATEATSQSGDSDAVRAAVAAMTGQPVPFPDDAVWIEVRVVDKATSEPVAEALVTWSDQTTNERIGKDQSLSQEDRNWLRRDQEKSNLRYGWQTISDAKGVARVHLSDNTLVVARREGRYGKLHLQKNTVPPRDGYRVELEPDIEVLVQVLDAHGTPAAGIPISVTQNDAKGNPVQMWRWEPIAITRAPDGIAALRHLQEWRAEMGQAGSSVAEWRVRTSLPGYEDKGVPFVIEAPGTEPVVLRLPPCGGVRVRAELHGEALTVIKTISLREKRDGNVRGGEMRNWMFQRVSRSCPTDAQGWAHFEHVPLGATYHASANAMSGYLGKEFKGPMTQDQSVTVLLTVGDDQILLTGRLLDEHKTVLADREFNLNVRGQYNDSSSTFRSDAQGRFLVLLGAIDKDRPRPLQRVSIVWREPPALLQADLTNRDYHAGVQDAGDVVLQPGKLVVAGRLVTGDAPCKLPVQPMIERHEVIEGRPEPRWRSQRDFQYVKGEEGHFEYRGEAVPGRYRLRFNSNNHLPVEPIEFAIGTKDLVVRIDTGAPLAASVLLPKDAPEGLRGVLVADGAPAVVEPLNWRQGGDRHTTQPWAQPDGRYQLQWRSIAPGTYTLQLQLWGDKEPLVSIASVQVPGPKGGDSRLVDIDLRRLVRIALVRLFDQNGQALDSYDGAFFPFGQDPEKVWLGYDVQGSTTRMLLRSQPLELLVCRRGFRPQQIHCAGETADAKLDPWPTVEIVFDGLPELPKETTLFARLAPRDVREAKYRSLWNDGDRTELMTVPGRGVKVAQGRALVPIGDGPHDVKLSVGGKRRSVDIDLPRRDAVLPNAQSLRVDLPAASLQQAIDKVNAPADGK